MGNTISIPTHASLKRRGLLDATDLLLCPIDRSLLIQSHHSALLLSFSSLPCPFLPSSLPPLITSIAIASCPTSPQPPPSPLAILPDRARSLPLAYRCRSHHFSYSAMRVTEQMAESEATIDRESGRAGERTIGRQEDGGSLFAGD